MVKQNVEPVKADVIDDMMTLSEIKERIALYQSAIENKKAVTVTDAVKAAKKAYQALTSQGIAMPSDVFVNSLQDLSDSERKTLSSELEGGLKPQTFAEYTLLDAIRDELISVAKSCNYKKSGRTSTGSPRKVKLSDYTCHCPICGDLIGNPSGRTQKHLIVNQVRLHMLNKHEIDLATFDRDYRQIVRDTTIATEDVIEEMR